MSKTQITKFVDQIKEMIPQNAFIDMNSSVRLVSKNQETPSDSVVEFHTTDNGMAKILSLKGNENRANLTFLVKREGEIVGINDSELKAEVEEHNKKIETGVLNEKPILFPIKTNSLKSVPFVSNGEFVFREIIFFSKDQTLIVNPHSDIDMSFEYNAKIDIKQFVFECKELIRAKAEASTYRYFITEYSAREEKSDERKTLYGEEGSKLLAKMGLTESMSFSPKVDQDVADSESENLLFREIKTYIKGSSSMNVKKSLDKYKKNVDPNLGDEIFWPIFDGIHALLNLMRTSEFVSFLKERQIDADAEVKRLSEKVSSRKFQLIVTDSWFDGVEKSDEIEYDDLVITVKNSK